MVLSVYQNVTAFPNQSATITKAVDSNTFNSFSEAIRGLDPNVTLSDLTVKLDSSTSWLNVSLTMSLASVAQTHGDLSVVDISWRSFNVSEDLRTGNLSYNLIGKRYFRPVYEYYVNASEYVGRPNATITGVSFFVNDTQSLSGGQAADSVGNATLLDFRSLSASLEHWERTYSLSNDTTSWRYTPPPLIADSIKVQMGNSTKQFLSRYNYTAEIVAPGLAEASGNTVLVDVGSGLKEWVMAGAVVLALACAVCVEMFFRSRKKKMARIRRK